MATGCLLTPIQIGAEESKLKMKHDYSPYSQIPHTHHFQYTGLSSMAPSAAVNIPGNGLDPRQLRYVYSTRESQPPI